MSTRSIDSNSSLPTAASSSSSSRLTYAAGPARIHTIDEFRAPPEGLDPRLHHLFLVVQKLSQKAQENREMATEILNKATQIHFPQEDGLVFASRITSGFTDAANKMGFLGYIWSWLMGSMTSITQANPSSNNIPSTLSRREGESNIATRNTSQPVVEEAE